MAKTKNLLEGLTQAELDRELYSRNDDDAYQYEEWKKSKEYIDMVNEEFNQFKPKYSESEVDNAIAYAFDQIQIPMEEVGKEVYEKLFRDAFYDVIYKK